MRIRKHCTLCTTAICALALGGCNSVEPLKLAELDLQAPPIEADIRVSDAKLFKREALINERRDQVRFLKTLIAESEKSDFSIQPEIIRNVEIIRAISASLGARIDPAAGINFDRQRERSDLEQEIALIELRMKLAQQESDYERLKKDLEDLEDEVEAQAEQESNENSGQGAPTAVTSLSSPSFETKGDEILSKIETTRSALEERLGNAVLTPTAAVANPADRFRDVQAYQALLRSALNAVSLDELHDADGNSLYRLQLAATVMPPVDEEYNDSLGVLYLEIEEPVLSEDDKWSLYNNWIIHLNREMNIFPNQNEKISNQKIAFNPEVYTIGTSTAAFTVFEFSFPKRDPEKEDLQKLEAKYTVAQKRTPQAQGGEQELYLAEKGNIRDRCKNLFRPADALDTEKCWSIFIALPQANFDYQEATFTKEDDRVFGGDRFLDLRFLLESPSRFEREFQDELAAIKDCELGSTRQFATNVPDARQVVLTSSTWSYFLSNSINEIVRAGGEQGQFREDLLAYAIPLFEKNAYITREVNADLANCRRDNPELYYRPRLPIDFTNALRAADPRTPSVFVYDLGPRETVQQLSTAARAADALSLASAVQAAAPSSGIGLNGSLGYSRSAVGKVDAIERAPRLIGFTQSSPKHFGERVKEPFLSKEDTERLSGAKPINSRNAAFGWLIGPKVNVDAEKASLFLKHVPSTYDLHADLSVPSWWPGFNLKVHTAWSPQSKGGRMYVSGGENSKAIPVKMQQNSADMNALTDLIVQNGAVGLSNRRPIIRNVAPFQLSACDTGVTLEIRGRNIWRADQITLGGKLFGADAAIAAAGEGAGNTAAAGAIIRVMPDMQGILATVNMKQVPVVDGQIVRLSVVTKDGQDTAFIPLKDIRGKDGNCSAPTSAPAKPTGPTIASVAPNTVSICDITPQFSVTGANLGDVRKATLGTVESSKVELTKSGKSVVVKFNSKALPIKMKGLDKTSLTLRTGDGAITQEVRIVNAACETQTNGQN